MKYNISIIVLITFLITVSCGQNKTTVKRKTENDIEKTWGQFLNTVQTANKQVFKKISNSKINCYYCIENTVIEQEELAVFRETDTLWYDKIYDDLVYIPIDRFIKDDFDIIFDASFLKILKEKEPKFSKNRIDGIDYYEILVTTTEPTEFHEGGQHSFQFIEIDGLWKFNEIGTIP